MFWNGGVSPKSGGQLLSRNIVIAAAGRKLGKTILSTCLVKELSAKSYRVAYFKLRRCKEKGVQFIPGPGKDGCDTWRMSEAGALEAGLLNYGPECDVMDYLPETVREYDVVLWETNSAAHQIPDAVIIYIDGNIEEPKNPELADEAVIHLEGPLESV